MEKPGSAFEKLSALMGLVSTLITIILNVFKIFEILPPYLQEWAGGQGLIWWWISTALLLSVGLWLVWLGLAPKSRLLRPERFILHTRDRSHLKGREEEIQELADLCERQPLVFLEGEAGSGKSALVQAGLADACLQRSRLRPIYVDLSGAAWEDGLTDLLAREVWHGLAENERRALALDSPMPAGGIFPQLAACAERLGRRPLLIFDQWDDYQNAYSQRFREGPRGNTWITRDTFIQGNAVWREIARLLQSGAIHCLFVTRADNAAGLDTVRFIEARTFRLARVNGSFIAPLLDEITLPGPDGRPVVVHPQRGWNLLKGRLTADLAEDDSVLPIQLSVALQALRRLPALTVREYERCGGAEGLERLHLERNLTEAAQASDLSVEKVRGVLLSLVDPVRRKTVQRRAGDLLAAAGEGAPEADSAATHGLWKALEFLEGRAIVRRRPGEEAGEDLWLLHHDFLCRGVLASERFADRWRILLREQAIQFQETAGALRRWSALLPPWQQVRLAWGRVTGKFRYGRERRFAMLSTLRFLPAVFLLVILTGGWVVYRIHEDDYRAECIFAAIQDNEQIRILASSSERVRWKVLRTAFGSESGAEQSNRRLPVLLHACLGLDPRGDLRERLWGEVVRPILTTDPGPHVLLLSFDAWEEVRGDSADAQLLARTFIRTGTQRPKAEWPDSLVTYYFPRLAPLLDPDLSRTMADELLQAMDRSADSGTVKSLADMLATLAPHLREKQARRLAGRLAEVVGTEEKNAYGFNELVGHLAACSKYLKDEDVEVLLASAATSIQEIVPAYWTGPVDQRLDTFKGGLKIIENLDTRQRQRVTERLSVAIRDEERALNLAKSARGLKLLAGRAGTALQKQAIRKLCSAISRTSHSIDIMALSSALGEYAPDLTPEEARPVIEKLLQTLEREKAPYNLGLLSRAMAGLAAWMDAAEARRACTRILEAVGAQDNPFAMENLLIGLSGIAPRLSDERRDALLENLIAERMKRAVNPSRNIGSMIQFDACLRDFAGRLHPEEALTIGRQIIDALQREKNPDLFYEWCTIAGLMADRLDTGQWRAIGDRIVAAMERDPNGDSLTGLGWKLAEFKERIEPPLLDRAAARLIHAAGLETDPDRLRYRAEALANLVDRLNDEALRAAQTAIDIFLKETEKERRDDLLSSIAELAPLNGKTPEPEIAALAERAARTLAEAAAVVDVYGVYDPEPIGNVTALLRHASDQALLDILKQPFAVGPFQKVMLQVWEHRYGQRFENDLRRFVQWATGDPRTKHLDFQSPALIDFSHEKTYGTSS